MRSCAINTSWSHVSLHTDVDAGQVAQSGVFRGADAVLDVGTVTVPQLERGDVRVGLVGDEDLMSEPVVDVEQGEVGAGMRPFTAGDHPGLVRASCRGRSDR